MRKIKFLDSHTGGEPTRLILEGFPDLTAGSMTDKLTVLKSNDLYRRAAAGEPRASDVLIGAALTPPVSAGSLAGVVFFNNVGYLGMCGHGTIGVIASLAYLGRITAGVHRLDTPVGTVECTLHPNGEVSVRNVPSFRLAKSVEVRLDDGRVVVGDVAWGGNWFFLCDAAEHAVSLANLDALGTYARAIKSALAAGGITGAAGAEIDHIELFADTPTADSRNYVLCPGNAYDRSPCGTGTSAKLACLAADGRVQAGQEWVQESVVGSRFGARFEWESTPESGRIIPTITGSAHVCAEGSLLIDESDPFAWGIGA